MARPKKTRPDADQLWNQIETVAQELNNESDRGCVLVAAAYLDDILASMLEKFFVGSPRNAKLKPDQVVDTFARRITIAFAVGLLDEIARSDLETVRAIRNDFAHSHGKKSFDQTTDRVANLQTYKNLEFVRALARGRSGDPLASQSTRDRFTLNVAFLISWLLSASRFIERQEVAGAVSFTRERMKRMLGEAQGPDSTY